MSLLEVIALTADDAARAEAGGADRCEVVGTMADDGLSPTAETMAAIRSTVSIELRAMVRCRAGFLLADDGPRLRVLTHELLDAGADSVVCGFLTETNDVDRDALTDLGLPARWTFHRAIDHSADIRRAWDDLLAGPYPAPDQVLTAGSPTGVADGLHTLAELAADPDRARRIIVGGGLAPAHVPLLRSAGIMGFHIGSPARVDRDFCQPVDPQAVEMWRCLIDAEHQAS